MTYTVRTGGKMRGICITPDESWILGDSKAGIIKVRAKDSDSGPRLRYSKGHGTSVQGCDLVPGAFFQSSAAQSCRRCRLAR